MKKLLLFVIFIISVQLYAQEIQFIDNVPESFKTKYFESQHEYNPLHIGDIFQYTILEDSSNIIIFDVNINKDTTVHNGLKYFYKDNGIYSAWERNDTNFHASYLLDLDDLDNDGNTTEELLLDSLEVPNFTEYISFRYIWQEFPPDYPTTAYVEDSSWAIVFGDTVMTRRVQYASNFSTVIVADKFGVIWSMPDGPPSFLTGAKINGEKYGLVVSVKDDDNVGRPTKFNLSQNYPNPFNPTTVIEYSLPVRQAGPGFETRHALSVQLKIFDILGREVATLVNEKQQPGNYKVNFDAGGLPSGIYVYKLQAGNFTSVKKMLLLK